MRAADDRDQRHLGQRADDRLDLAGIDPFASRLDEILRAPGDADVTVRVDDGEIAGVEPAVRVDGGCLVAEVAFDDARAAHAQAAFAPSLLGQRHAVGIGEQQVDADRRTPGLRRLVAPAPLGGVTVPNGDSSVIPQLVWTQTPRRFSRRSISACGTEAPPIMIRSSDGTSAPVRSRCSTSPSHTVATPAASVDVAPR